IKNAVLQGFSLKNRKTCETTNRVIQQVYYDYKQIEEGRRDRGIGKPVQGIPGRITVEDTGKSG
ncbi:MAG: hypothetical protein LBB98_14735, partial [Treponema sp.]|nr:hypothetical protein [Treponema sp.]